MDRAGDQLLAGPALAGDEHRRIGRRHAGDAAVDVAHRLAVADHVVIEIERGPELAVRVFERLGAPLVLERRGGDAGNRHHEPEMTLVEAIAARRFRTRSRR